MTVSLTDDPVGYYVALADEQNVSSGPLKAHFDFEVHDVGTHPESGDPTDPDGGDTAAVIARLQKAHPEFFSPSKTYGANVTHKPSAYRSPGPQGKPQN